MKRLNWQFDRNFWKRDWFIGVAVTLVFLIAASGTTLQSLERNFYDLAITLTAERPAIDQVTVVEIDEETVSRLGPWPIPRDVLADALRIIENASPKAVGIALDLQQTHEARGVEALRDLRNLNATAAPGSIPADFSRRFDALLNDAERKISGNQILAGEIQSAGNVILGVPYRIRHDLSQFNLLPVAGHMSRFAIPMSEAKDLSVSDKIATLLGEKGTPEASSFRVPAEALSNAALALGHYAPHVDFDGRVRFERLVVEYQKQYYPSLSLSLAAVGMGNKIQDIRITEGEGVSIGTQWLDTDRGLRLMPYYYKRKGNKPAFNTVSFQNVVNKQAADNLFRDRIVLVGLTHPDLVDPVSIPTGESVAPLMVMANTVASILNGDYYRVPDWAPWVNLLTILLVTLFLVSLLPRIRIGTGLALSAVSVVLLANVYIIAMVAQGIWLQLITPIAQLLVGHAIFVVKRGYVELVSRAQTENAEANRMLASSFQSQGQLDMAFEKYRKCPIDDSLMELMYSLGQDYERKRQFSRAAAVFRYMSTHNPTFRDIAKRILSNNEAAGAQVSSTPGMTPSGGTLVLKNNGVQKPMLGRFQVEEEIGRGAMGMVYMGSDPKIGRKVAIKTMALSQEFGADQIDEVKERFFREASTAGRLNHPNIVTIYDVGEEHDLAYIAMDYLEGVNLSEFTRSDSLLPLPEVFYIVGKIAEALDYAHAHQVVHRDIKPANVMYNAVKKQVTVTDFGVAFLVDANKTKTGTILGTPSYMSPEQLSGQKVDGRSDLFALGVMFFQMVTGELPFIGDSIATLLYKIANEQHPDPRMFRPDLPVCVGRVIDKALRKEIDRRFQSGKQFVTALKKCQEIIEKSKAQVTA